MNDDDVARLRVEYDAPPLRARAAGSDPMVLFSAWFAAARAAHADRAAGCAEANAMSLATAAVDGTPSARMVLLKTVDEPAGAFGWFTNLGSRKAREALGSGRAALCWYWPGVTSRQVRAVGRVEEVDALEAARYFQSRPTEARVGAIVSSQSRPVASRAELDLRADALMGETGSAGDTRAGGISAGRLAMPADWGGLRLVADELEFWQGRQGRLHDRISFLRLDADGMPISSAAIAAVADTPEEGLAALRDAGTVVTDAHGTSWLRVRLEP